MQTNGYQPIHAAAAMGFITIIKKLVEHYKVPLEPASLVINSTSLQNRNTCSSLSI